MYYLQRGALVRSQRLKFKLNTFIVLLIKLYRNELRFYSRLELNGGPVAFFNQNRQIFIKSDSSEF